MNTSRWRGLVAVCGGLLWTVGCSDPGATDDGAEHLGRVKVVMTSSALSAAEIARITANASSEALGQSLDTELANSGVQWTGGFAALPVGTDWAFRGQAFDQFGELGYEGVVAPVTIEADRTAYVSLNLDQVPAAVPFENSSPRIRALTASAIEVQPLELVTFGVQAVDPDGDTLTYEWSADQGAFDDANATRVHWRAPRFQGTYLIDLQVYDPRGLSAAATIEVRVLNDVLEGSAEINATVNTFPVVQDVFVKPTPIPVGEAVGLGVTAIDTDGDALTYAWTTSCDGTFDATDVDFPYFTLDTLPDSGSCTFTVVVDDGRGGSNYGTVDVAAGSTPPVVVGPATGTQITGPGEAWGHHGTCSGWNDCGDADTCALWACLASGYTSLVSHGAEGVAAEFEIVNMLNAGPDNGFEANWSPGDKSWCPVSAVTDIVCN